MASATRARSLEDVFRALQKKNGVEVPALAALLASRGLDLATDVRLDAVRGRLAATPGALSEQAFVEALAPAAALVIKAFNNDFVVKDWEQLVQHITAVYELLKPDDTGHVATYIPQLASVDPSKFAISICTIDGQRFHIGDTRDEFTLQSVAIPLLYMVALERDGARVHESVGCEPSGKHFNEIVVLPDGRPHNPYVNAGAIATLSHIKCAPPTYIYDAESRYTLLKDKFTDMAGHEHVGFDNAVSLSEKSTGHRNMALSRFMKVSGAFPPEVVTRQDIDANVFLYFDMCSITMNTRSLSVVAATMANEGVNPLSNKTCIRPENVANAVRLMHTCGMYNYSGKFAFEVGLPAKSGVSGDLLLVVPGVLGIALWSPRLNKESSYSERAVKFCVELTKRMQFPGFNCLPPAVHDSSSDGLRPMEIKQSRAATCSDDLLREVLFQAVSTGNIVQVRQVALQGASINAANADGTTALMVACACGSLPMAKQLVRLGASVNAENQARQRPLDFVQPENEDLIQFLRGKDAIGKPGSAGG